MESNNRKLIIYSKDNCPQCVKLLNKIKKLQLDIEVLKLDEDFTTEDILKIKPSYVRTYPVVFERESDGNLKYINHYQEWPD